MMSLTQTETIAKPAAVPLVMRTTEEALIKRMEESPIFAPAKDKIREWLANFNAMQHNDARSDALAFLLFGLIRPAIVENPRDAAFLLGLEDALKSLLGRYLPRGANMDLFLNEYRGFFEEFKIRKELNESQYTVEFFEEILNQLFQNANSLNERWEAIFDTYHQPIVNFGVQRVTVNEDLLRRINALNQKVDRLTEQMTKVAEDQVKTGRRVEAQRQTFDLLLKKYQETFHEFHRKL